MTPPLKEAPGRAQGSWGVGKQESMHGGDTQATQKETGLAQLKGQRAELEQTQGAREPGLHKSEWFSLLQKEEGKG